MDKHRNAEFLLNFIDLLKLGKFHSIFSRAKVKGISSVLIIKVLIIFPFLDQKNIHNFTQSHWSSFFELGKDVYYRLKNNPKINWRSFLFAVTRQLLKTLSKRQDNQVNDSSSQVKAFIFDDTVIAKTSDKTEGISRVWNHVIQKQYHKRRDKNTSRYQRKKELNISKIKAMVKMLRQAVKQDIDAQYVLTDSWFAT